MVLGKLSSSPAAFLKNTEVKLHRLYAERFPGVGIDGFCGWGMLLVFLGVRNTHRNQPHLNGFPAFRDYLRLLSETVNGCF